MVNIVNWELKCDPFTVCILAGRPFSRALATIVDTDLFWEFGSSLEQLHTTIKKHLRGERNILQYWFQYH